MANNNVISLSPSTQAPPADADIAMRYLGTLVSRAFFKTAAIAVTMAVSGVAYLTMLTILLALMPGLASFWIQLLASSVGMLFFFVYSAIFGLAFWRFQSPTPPNLDEFEHVQLTSADFEFDVLKNYFNKPEIKTRLQGILQRLSFPNEALLTLSQLYHEAAGLKKANCTQAAEDLALVIQAIRYHTCIDFSPQHITTQTNKNKYYAQFGFTCFFVFIAACCVGFGGGIGFLALLANFDLPLLSMQILSGIAGSLLGLGMLGFRISQIFWILHLQYASQENRKKHLLNTKRFQTETEMQTELDRTQHQSPLVKLVKKFIGLVLCVFSALSIVSLKGIPIFEGLQLLMGTAITKLAIVTAAAALFSNPIFSGLFGTLLTCLFLGYALTSGYKIFLSMGEDGPIYENAPETNSTTEHVWVTRTGKALNWIIIAIFAVLPTLTVLTLWPAIPLWAAVLIGVGTAGIGGVYEYKVFSLGAAVTGFVEIWAERVPNAFKQFKADCLAFKAKITASRAYRELTGLSLSSQPKSMAFQQLGNEEEDVDPVTISPTIGRKPGTPPTPSPDHSRPHTASAQ